MSTQQQPLLAGKKVIVAGAGIAGLSFALALRKQWPAVASSLTSSAQPPTIIIYERNSQKLSADQDGYSLSIRSDPYSGGMQVLRKIGLLKPMLRASLTGTNVSDAGFVLWDRDWKEILKVKAKSFDKDLQVPSMRIARKALRQILLEAVSSNDSIQWGVSCTNASYLENGKVHIHLSTGETEECDLLIAADGANSTIRARLRPNDGLSFAGAVCITGEATFPDAIPAPLHQDWGTIIGAGGISLFASPIDAHNAVWSLSYLSPTPRARLPAPLTPAQAEQLKHEALERGRCIAPPFATLVHATPPAALTIFNPKDKTPFAHDGDGAPIIFIGDSNHAMTPFAGNGANLALMDGWDLAAQLCTASTTTTTTAASSLRAALAAYDAVSRPRAASAIRISHWSIAIAHAQGWRLALYVLLLRVMRFLFFRSAGRS